MSNEEKIDKLEKAFENLKMRQELWHGPKILQKWYDGLIIENKKLREEYKKLSEVVKATNKIITFVISYVQMLIHRLVKPKEKMEILHAGIETVNRKVKDLIKKLDSGAPDIEGIKKEVSSEIETIDKNIQKLTDNELDDIMEAPEDAVSKNVVFPTKLSYQEEYPTSSIYKTPKYIENLRKAPEDAEEDELKDLKFFKSLESPPSEGAEDTKLREIMNKILIKKGLDPNKDQWKDIDWTEELDKYFKEEEGKEDARKRKCSRCNMEFDTMEEFQRHIRNPLDCAQDDEVPPQWFEIRPRQPMKAPPEKERRISISNCDKEKEILIKAWKAEFVKSLKGFCFEQCPNQESDYCYNCLIKFNIEKYSEEAR